jgi:hypothetical protein
VRPCGCTVVLQPHKSERISKRLQGEVSDPTLGPMSPDSRQGSRPRLMTPGLATLLAVFLATAVVDVIILTGHGGGAWLVPTVVLLFVAMVSVSIYALRQRRRDEAASGQVDCSLRTVAGDHDGLSSRWRSGAAIITPHEVSFQRMVGGVRFLPGRRTTLRLAQVGPALPEATGWRTALAVQPGSAVVTLHTLQGATVEAAFSPGRLAWALDRLQSQDSSR